MSATTDHSSTPLFLQRTLVPPSTAILPTSVPSSSFSTSIRPCDSITPKPFLPRTTLRNSSDHDQNLRQLLSFQELFHKREFWDECAILERMYYKNKSQHRHAGYFQRFCECRRLISRIKELDIAGLTGELVRKFYSGKSLKTIASASDRWDSIPQRSTMAFTLTRIISAILLQRKFQSTLHETYGAFYQLLSKTQFMPFALIAIGLCSRLSIMSKAWTTEFVECYELLATWMKLFPKEVIVEGSTDYEKQLPTTLESVIAINMITASEIPEISEIPGVPGISTSLQSSSPSVGVFDLGEVIQRTPLSVLFSSSNISSSPSMTLESSLPSSPTKETDQDSTHQESDEDQAHASSLSELDTAIRTKSPSNIKRTKSVPEDSIAVQNVEEWKKKKVKVQRSDKSTLPLSGSSSKSKESSGSSTNFDDIFNFGQKSLPSPVSSLPTSSTKPNKGSKDKREIDDIFSKVKPKQKEKQKGMGSEIDQIFGQPKKKKKKTS
ncbi:MAG: hypothetical protein J3Q66DRAFT_348117 [Benniella sp.]|nr:MAG: hypothetical protein J3Q66DRAFT_348117 [Benniella sp.]